MDDRRPNHISGVVKALLRLALGIAIVAALAPAPASSGPLLEKCPNVKAISV